MREGNTPVRTDFLPSRKVQCEASSLPVARFTFVNDFTEYFLVFALKNPFGIKLFQNLIERKKY